MFPLQSRPKRVILEKRVISDDASLAQLVEQLTCNQQVVGSSPTAGSIFFSQISLHGPVSHGRIFLFALRLFKTLFADLARSSKKYNSHGLKSQIIYSDLHAGDTKHFFQKSCERIFSGRDGIVEDLLFRLLKEYRPFYCLIFHFSAVR